MEENRVVTDFSKIYAKIRAQQSQAQSNEQQNGPKNIIQPKQDTAVNENYQDLLNSQNELLRAERKTFVHGIDLTPPIMNMNEAEFPKAIHDNLFKNGYRSIFPIQSRSWNEIAKNRSMLIVHRRNTGKTMTVIPPLLGLLSNNKENCMSHISQGPIAIIITQTSIEVENLFKICFKLAPQVITVAAFGIWNLQQKRIDLLNGCDLLITTPACFTRFAQTDALKMFDRNRIKHLVFENLDLMLGKFKTDIINVLQICTKDCENLEENPQIIITATCWQEYLRNYLKILHLSIVVIGNYIEAALYAKSRFSVAKKSLDEKNVILMDFLTRYEWRTKKTAIVFTDEKEMDDFKVLLGNKFIEYYVLDKNTRPCDINNWTMEYSGRMTLLLILDDIPTEIFIGCVQILIHYSLPSTWSDFSRRFTLSVNYYKFYVELSEKDEEKEPRTIVILDCEKNIIEMPRILNFLTDRRLIKHIPGNIKKHAEQIMNAIETSKVDSSNGNIVPLCTQILKFGFCSLLNCKNRHAFIPDDQAVSQPQSGRIKFKIIGSSSPLHYAIIITDHLPGDGRKWIYYKEKIKYARKCLAKFQEYMEDEANQLMDGEIKIGRLYAYYATKTLEWRRCKIIHIKESQDEFKTKDVTIKFLDFASQMTVRSTTLMKLPDDLCNLQPVACDIRVVNMVPYDFDQIFDEETISVVEKYLSKSIEKGDFLMCDIEMAVEGTIITKNFHVCKALENSKCEIIKLSLKKFLLENNYAAIQEDGFEKLKRIAENSNFKVFTEKRGIAVEANVEAPIQQLNVSNERILSIGKTYKAKLLNFINPESFYVLIVDKNSEAVSKLDEISNYQCQKPLQSFSENQMCLVYSKYGKLARCIVKKIVDPQVQVFLLDYGITEKAKPADLYDMPNHFVHAIPFQAIECGIKGLKAKTVTMRNNFGFKMLFSKVSNRGIFEMEVHSKHNSKYVVSIRNSETKLDIKELALSQNLAEMSEQEKKDRELMEAIEQIKEMMKSDENVHLEQEDANRMLGLPETARFVPPPNALPDVTIETGTKCRKLSEIEYQDGNESVSVPKSSLPRSRESYLSELCKADNFLKTTELKKSSKITEPSTSQKSSSIPPQISPISTNIYATMNIEWFQNGQVIMLKIEGTNFVDYSLKISEINAEICIKYQEKNSLAVFDFYGRILPKLVSHKTNGSEIVIFLVKKFVNSRWPRLTLKTVVKDQIKYNHEELKIMTSDDFMNFGLKKPVWKPGGYYSDNEEDYGEYDDALDKEEVI